MRLPDLNKLLRRPDVEKPQEEFLLPPPTDLPAPDPSPAGAPETAATEVDLLYAEAARLQELYDLVVATAEPVTVPVPDADQQLLGAQVNTSDYLKALGDPSPKAKRTRQAFEDGLLSQTGCGFSAAWPLLAADRMLSFRDGLTRMAQVLEGSLLPAAVPGQGGLTNLRVRPEFTQLQRTMVGQSASYRAGFARAVGSMYAGLAEGVLNCLFEPVGNTAVEELRPVIQELLETLQLIKKLLCTAMLLRMLEFRQLRSALQALFEQMLLEMFMQLLGQLIGGAYDAVIEPLLKKLTGGPMGGMTGRRDCDPLALVGSAGANALGEVLYGAMASLSSYYTEVLSDLLRENRRRTDGALSELQVLGERNVIGRWINQLDEAIQLCSQLLAQLGSLQQAQALVAAFVRAQLPTPDSLLYQGMAAHPEYKDALSLNWEFRRTATEPVA